MKIDHIHFFVEDAVRQRDWFILYMGWKSVGQATLPDRFLEVLCYRNTYFVISSPRTSDSPVAQYLLNHAPGIVDVAFVVEDLSEVLKRLENIPDFIQKGSGFTNVGKISVPNTQSLLTLSQIVYTLDDTEPLTCLCVEGWGGVRHTLIEKRASNKFSVGFTQPQPWETHLQKASNCIDHIVLNVPRGEIQSAVEFYQCFLGLQKQQSFQIQTERSGLNSQVLFSLENQFYFNINEPTSANSQIQEFLNANHGAAGIQHIALHSEPIVETISTLRHQGLSFLSVPLTYYHQLEERLGSRKKSSILTINEWEQIIQQKILIDWQPENPESLLLQIFSLPIFPKSHFFFEFIERRKQSQGFGEGNFLALYKAIEAESQLQSTK